MRGEHPDANVTGPADITGFGEEGDAIAVDRAVTIKTHAGTTLDVYQHVIASERASPIGREFPVRDQELDTVGNDISRTTQFDTITETIITRAKVYAAGMVQVDPIGIIPWE